MTDGSTLLSQKITPKKRKAPEVEAIEFNKEPRLMDLNNLDTLQRGRLKSAYEWGNLEDAIYDNSQQNGQDFEEDDTDKTINTSDISLDSSMVTDVMAAADTFSKSASDEDVSKKMEKLNEERNEIISKVVDDTVTNVVVVQETLKQQHRENGFMDKPKAEAFNISWEPTEPVEHHQNHVDLPKSLENSIKKFIETESRNGFTEPPKNENSLEYNNYTYKPTDHITISPIHFQFKSNEDGRGTSNDATEDHVKIINYGTNMPDDVKVSRYPFGSLERPKSDVLKKLLAQADELNRVVTSTSMTTIKHDSPPQSLSSITVDSSHFIDVQPISLTSSNSAFNGAGNKIETELTDATQISPVFSSDGQGINSISISSMEVNIRPDSRKSDALPALLGLENVVTISSSQPSSIILIDDEKIDFTLRTLDEAEKQFVNSVPKDEVFIIESLSSKKIQEPLTNGTKTDENAKTFVTEIRVQTPNDDKSTDLKTTIKDDEEDNEMQERDNSRASNISLSSVSIPSTPTSPVSPASSPNDKKRSSASEKSSASHEDEYIPRNSEIKFTTATYESPTQRHMASNEKRHSQIDQIRSTFERNHSLSEIPVPIRKTSIPSIRTSPSKIPVFNSTKINSLHSSNNDLSMKNSSNGHTNINNNNNNNTNGTNRVIVSVTSIKNSSRNPSGK